MKITRYIPIEENDAKVEKKAVEIILEPELSLDKFFFRYKIKSLDLDYAKAKTKGDYDYIDFKIDIDFKTVTFSDKKYEVSDLRTFTVNVFAVLVGGTYTPDSDLRSNWIPLPAAPHVSSPEIRPFES